MKKLIILSASVFALTITAAQAQSTVNERNNLKGPKAKNQKVGQKTVDQQAEVFLMPSGELKGPEAKNTTVAERATGTELVTSKGGNRIMGPKGKNQRPGQQNTSSEVIGSNQIAQK